MTETLSLPMDIDVTGFEAWEDSEVLAGIRELDAGTGVPHEQVAAWLRTWGTAEETSAPA